MSGKPGRSGRKPGDTCPIDPDALREMASRCRSVPALVRWMRDNTDLSPVSRRTLAWWLRRRGIKTGGKEQ